MHEQRFPDDWRGALTVAIQACRRGRTVLMEHFGRLAHIEKKFQAGLVSEADRNSEAAIIAVLRQHYPHSEILAEESAAAGLRVSAGRGGSAGRWILDPLDGTTNYIHRFPVFCISLALEVEGDLRVAVIDVPFFGEVYTAVRGQGAFINGRPLRVSSTERLQDALLATGFFAEKKDLLDHQLQLFQSVVGEARGIRRAGAAAYDMAMVAAGVFDGFWEQGLSPWDVAAGQLLVEEAGGVVKDLSGSAHTPYSGAVLCGNAAMVSLVSQRFAAIRGSHLSKS